MSEKKIKIDLDNDSTKSFISKDKFEDIIMEDTKIKKFLDKTDLEKLLYSKNKIKHIDDIFREAFET